MNDKLRADLRARLSEAMERQSQIEEKIQAHVDGIDQIRQSLGNPYFFQPRAADDPESRARYTGYTSHDPGLQLVRARQDVQREITGLLNRLGALEQ